MTLSAHQPCYLPWLGYFYKLAHCDLFVVLDDAPLRGVDKDNWVNRVWISGPPGDTLLTVPLRRKGHAGEPIRSIEVDGDRWVVKHRRALAQTYTHALHRFQLAFSELSCEWWNTAAKLQASAWQLAAWLNIPTQVTWQSWHASSGHGEDMLLDLCRHFNADRFLFGRNGCNYVTFEKWKRAGIEPVFQNFLVPEYPRLGPPTMRILSTVDAIANVGMEHTREIIMAGTV